jgi:hypothetical protein
VALDGATGRLFIAGRADSQPELIDQFLMDQRIDVLITNRPGHAARRRSEIAVGCLVSGARR